MKKLGLIVLCLMALGVFAESAHARHGYKVKYRGAYVVGYPAPAYYVPAPAYYAPVPVGPYYGPVGPAFYGGPSPFVHPRVYPYYGW